MSAFLESYVSSVLLAIPASRSRFAAAVGRSRWLRSSFFDPYQPELYYMRGPGPKCREKVTRCAGS
jgi:hypothetical protein